MARRRTLTLIPFPLSRPSRCSRRLGSLSARRRAAAVAPRPSLARTPPTLVGGDPPLFLLFISPSEPPYLAMGPQWSTVAPPQLPGRRAGPPGGGRAAVERRCDGAFGPRARQQELDGSGHHEVRPPGRLHCFSVLPPLRPWLLEEMTTPQRAWCPWSPRLNTFSKG